MGVCVCVCVRVYVRVWCMCVCVCVCVCICVWVFCVYTEGTHSYIFLFICLIHQSALQSYLSIALLNGDKIANARFKARAANIELAVSTMCFEYWLLLHFEENDKSALDCECHIRLLKKHLPQYNKGTCDFLPIVKRVSEACNRAEKLRRPGLNRGDLPENQNPCSEVYLLIQAMGLWNQIVTR